MNKQNKTETNFRIKLSKAILEIIEVEELATFSALKEWCDDENVSTFLSSISGDELIFNTENSEGVEQGALNLVNHYDSIANVEFPKITSERGIYNRYAKAFSALNDKIHNYLLRTKKEVTS